MQEASNISMTISTGWVSTPSTSRKQKTACTQLRGCIPQLEYSFRYGPTTENGWWKRVVLQQGAERLLVADHDRYWNRCQQTERYVASQNRGRTQDRPLPTAMPTVWKLQIMMPASLSFPTAGNTTLPPSSWTHTRRMRTMRTSSPAYHAWYMMRWDERGKGAIGSSSYKFWYSGISCRKI